MINSFEVLNTPHPGTKWVRGDKLILPADNKNLLLVGENGTGKTTFLNMIRRSLIANRSFENGNVEFETNNPYMLFARKVAGDSYLIGSGEWHIQAREDRNISDEDLPGIFLEIFEEIVSQIFDNGIMPIWDGVWRTNERLLGFTIGKSVESLDEWRSDGPPNVLRDDETIYAFVATIDAYAQKYWHDADMVRGVILQLITRSYSCLDHPVARFGYVELGGEDLAKKDVIASSDIPKDTTELSLGQRSMAIIDRVTTGCIALLDEPTEWIALKTRSTYIARIAELSRSAQIIASTHESGMLDMATSQGWTIYDLDEKSVVSA